MLYLLNYSQIKLLLVVAKYLNKKRLKYISEMMIYLDQ